MKNRRHTAEKLYPLFVKEIGTYYGEGFGDPKMPLTIMARLNGDTSLIFRFKTDFSGTKSQKSPKKRTPVKPE